MGRWILHADLDAFFASVEQRDFPELRGKPIAVGGSGGRGVVAAASYEAREFGVRSAMPMSTALSLCKSLIVVPHRMDAYQEASHQFFGILDRYSPVVEGLSVDEAFLDLSGTERLLGPPAEVASAIQRDVAAELSLVVSVGVAPSKFVAKIASDIDKPKGLRVVGPKEVTDFLWPLPVSRLWGVGKVAQKRLHDVGLKTIGDVAAFPRELLLRKLGENFGAHIAALAHGQDPRRVQTGRQAVSIGHEQTFASDISEKAKLRPILLEQADRVARRLRRKDRYAQCVTLKIKYSDFRSITRQKTLGDATNNAEEIATTCYRLLDSLDVGEGPGRSVRLCGLSVSGIVEKGAAVQLRLDGLDGGSNKKAEAVGELMDRIKDRFGDESVVRASYAKQSGKKNDPG